MHRLPHRIPRSPVVPRPRALLVHVKVLRIVDVLIRARLDAVDHTRLQIEQDSARDVARVVGLVKKDIFAVATFGRKIFKVAVLTDAVLLAELLPELAADWAVLVYCCERGKM
jgi:hypothetical protein